MNRSQETCLFTWQPAFEERGEQQRVEYYGFSSNRSLAGDLFSWHHDGMSARGRVCINKKPIRVRIVEDDALHGVVIHVRIWGSVLS
jgi:hypothetical protein